MMVLLSTEKKVKNSTTLLKKVMVRNSPLDLEIEKNLERPSPTRVHLVCNRLPTSKPRIQSPGKVLELPSHQPHQYQDLFLLLLELLLM